MMPERPLHEVISELYRTKGRGTHVTQTNDYEQPAVDSGPQCEDNGDGSPNFCPFCGDPTKLSYLGLVEFEMSWQRWYCCRCHGSFRV